MKGYDRMMYGTVIFIAFIVLLAPLKAYSQNLYGFATVLKFEFQCFDADYKRLLEQNKNSKIDIPASLIVNGEHILENIGIRYKGNSSYKIPNDKKSFNISVDSFVNGQRLWGYKTINLNNGFVDPTFMREAITNNIFRKYMPALKTGYVQVSINGENYGLYANIQQINKDFLREWYASIDGNLYKGDPRGDLTWKGNDPAPYKMDYEKKTNEKLDDWSDLIRLIAVINNSTDIEKDLPTVLDVDRAIWYFALCNVLVNLDSYIYSAHNYYLYNNPSTGLFEFLPWDMNEAFGVFPPQLLAKETFPIVNDTIGPGKPLLKKLMSVPKFRAMYFAHYKTILKESFTPEYINNLITTLKPVIQNYVRDDPKKLYTYQQFEQNLNADVQAGRRIPGLLSFVIQRRDFLVRSPDLSVSSPVIKSVECAVRECKPGRDAGFIVTTGGAATRNVELHYRIGSGRFYSVVMFDDGNHADGVAGDWVYGVSIHVSAETARGQIDFYATAMNNENVMSFFPERAAFEFLSIPVSSAQYSKNIVINEFMASNTKTIQDLQGAYPDWIELFNTSDSAVSLHGYYLTDDIENPRKWRFPDVNITGKGYLLVWADGDTLDSGLHSNFQLSRSGEYIGLYDSNLNLIDSYTFGEQSQDVSEGRYPDGAEGFAFMIRPTPAYKNIMPLVVDDVTQEIPRIISLFQNFPNPFNSSTIITYTLLERSLISLSIFNIAGQELWQCKSGIQEPGTHEFVFKGENLPSGLYFARIKVKGHIAVIRMLLMK